ncbi:MAG: WYL domain-containing protein [Prevotellaceae bacterium]|jgi:predicted DNA-binding transcriptional regulator YafY|nr:WYL domain-containing protein [Prevotellaceae bacterium]
MVDTIRRHQPVTYEELEAKIIQSGQFDKGDIMFSERTFFRDAHAIESIFGIVLFFDRKTKGYYIKEAQSKQEQHMLDWMLHTFRHANILEVYRDQAEHILLESPPKGNEHLPVILEGIRSSDTLTMDLKRFRTFKTVTIDIIPYFVRLFRLEWYLVAKDLRRNIVRIFPLDKIAGITKTGKKFKLPEDEDYPEATTFFNDYFGVITEEDVQRETIRIMVSGDTVKQLRTTPLHSSQVETEATGDAVVFSVRLHPTSDFIQELCRYGKELKVLSPAPVKEKVIAFAKAILENYEL